MNKYTIYFQGRVKDVEGSRIRDDKDYWVIFNDFHVHGEKHSETVAIVPKGALITVESIK